MNIHSQAMTEHTDLAASNAQTVIRSVISDMVADARRAGRHSREQLDVLDGHLQLYEEHLARVVEDFAQRVATIRNMYALTADRAVAAQAAVFAAPLTPPIMPALPASADAAASDE